MDVGRRTIVAMHNSIQYFEDISFVVIGKNAERDIARLLASIVARTPAQVTSEIIYVDSASTDRSVEIVARYPATIVQLSASRPLCASAGRYMGSKYATGRYVAFFDSDMELLDGWLEQALRVLDDNPKIAVVSGIQIDGDLPLPSAKQQTADAESDGHVRFNDVQFAGSAAVFRHEVLDAAGTWNPYIISDEEPELCLRIRRAGHRIVEVACPSVRHFGYAAFTISALLDRRKRRLFLGYGQVIRYHLFSGFVLAYLRERGWMVLPALAGCAAIGAGIVSWVSGDILWAAGFAGVMVVAFVLDAVRCRSLHRAMCRMLQRALILEGTIRGMLLRLYPPNEYPHDARVSAVCDRRPGEKVMTV
ncbi:MAG: glycosyltransferase [Acidobacteriaceae bacterium]